MWTRLRAASTCAASHIWQLTKNMLAILSVMVSSNASKKPRWSNLPGLMRPVSNQNGESEAVAVALIDDVKLALRITSNVFDKEVEDLINAARQDLILSGISQSKAYDENDPLIKRAVTVYCKTHFGYDNPEAERFQQAYNMLKTHLALSEEYAVGDGA